MSASKYDALAGHDDDDLILDERARGSRPPPPAFGFSGREDSLPVSMTRSESAPEAMSAGTNSANNIWGDNPPTLTVQDRFQGDWSTRKPFFLCSIGVDWTLPLYKVLFAHVSWLR